MKSPGTNNDFETLHALKEAGAHARIVHVNELTACTVRLEDFGIMVIPGGFSYGDDLGAGKVLSLFLEYKLRNDLIKFIRKGKIVMGICNGFQVLAKAKLLPEISSSQKVTLGFNQSGRFVCKWVRLKVNKDIFWFKGLPDEIELPVAHAEGRFMASPRINKDLIKKGQTVLHYIDNPNGSQNNIAGITNSDGNVLGMMPHPERFFYPFQHPGFRNKKVIPWGKRIFRNVVKNA